MKGLTPPTQLFDLRIRFERAASTRHDGGEQWRVTVRGEANARVSTWDFPRHVKATGFGESFKAAQRVAHARCLRDLLGAELLSAIAALDEEA
jgi:hypothetical protein